MTWYYAEGSQQRGPYDEAQFEALIQAGTITPPTLVWGEGMPNWLPLAQVRPGVGVGAGVVGGAPAGWRALPVDAAALLEEIKQSSGQIEIGQCLSRGWDLVKNNFLVTVVAVALLLVISIGLSLMGAALEKLAHVPAIGTVVSLIITGPLTGGMYYLFLKLIRREKAGVEDVFSGFSKAFGRLVGGYVAVLLLSAVWFIPGGVALAMAIIPLKGAVPSLAALAPGIILCFLALAPAIYLSVCFFFVLPLIVDLGLGVGKALQVSRAAIHKNWLNMFLLLVVCSLLNILGVLVCLVGVVVTLAIFHASVMYAYEDIFSVK